MPQISDREYFFRVVDLAGQLANALTLCANARIQTTPETIAYQATVYVAPVNDSLFDQRSQLVNELTQFGIRSLPVGNRFEADMDKILQQCSHFIQLLDTNYSFGVPQNQHLIAQTADLPILQWRDQNLDVGKANHEQKALLQGESVIAGELSDFIRQVRDVVLPKSPVGVKPSVNGNKMVFVHASQADFDSAKHIAQALRSRGFGISTPAYKGDVELVRKSIELGYQFCDFMLLLQQKASAEVIADYLSDAMIKTMHREMPLPVLICQCSDAEELFFIPPGVKTLICRDRFEDDCLDQFLAAEVDA